MIRTLKHDSHPSGRGATRSHSRAVPVFPPGLCGRQRGIAHPPDTVPRRQIGPEGRPRDVGGRRDVRGTKDLSA